MHQGDDKVIEDILRTTAHGQEKRHREAAIAVFCKFCILGLVSDQEIGRLTEFARDDTLDSRLRCRAIEAIGLTTSSACDGARERIHSIAMSDTTEIGWRSLEALVRRKWVRLADEDWLYRRLDLSPSYPGPWPDDATRMDGWRGFVLGLLFRSNKEQFGRAISEVLRVAPADVVYQVLDSLKFHGQSCPSYISERSRAESSSQTDGVQPTQSFSMFLRESLPPGCLL